MTSLDTTGDLLSPLYNYRTEFRRLQATQQAGKDVRNPKISLLEHYVTELEGHNEKLRDALEEVIAEKDKLRCQHDVASGETSRLQKTVTSLKAEVTSLREWKSETTCKMEEARAELGRAEGRLAKTEREMVFVADHARHLESVVKQKESDIHKLGVQEDSRQDEVECLRRKLENAVRELTRVCGAKDKLQEVVGLQKEELGHYKDLLMSAEAHSEHVERKVEVLRRQIHHMDDYSTARYYGSTARGAGGGGGGGGGGGNAGTDVNRLKFKMASMSKSATTSRYGQCEKLLSELKKDDCGPAKSQRSRQQQCDDLIADLKREIDTCGGGIPGLRSTSFPPRTSPKYSAEQKQCQDVIAELKRDDCREKTKKTKFVRDGSSTIETRRRVRAGLPKDQDTTQISDSVRKICEKYGTS